MTVDVAINVYGKPYETAVTLLSLLKFSGKHINKIYFTLESRQPHWYEYQFVTELLGEKVIKFIPRYWLWVYGIDNNRINSSKYRYSIRYQYAWEKTSADYLYVTHNDVLYVGDIIGAMLDSIDGSIAIGQVGQCWNCPAFSTNVCNGDVYWDYRPTRSEVLDLHRKNPNNRGYDYEKWINREGSWPLPECRLNEWAALIDMKQAKSETFPVGEADPVGGLSLDVGTKWFQYISRRGFRIKNFDVSKYAIHGWTDDEHPGHQSLFDKSQYERSEAIAKNYLSTEWGVKTNMLQKLVWLINAAAFKLRTDFFRAVSVLERKLLNARESLLRP